MRAPASFIVIAVILLIWNLMGITAFITQYSADLTELAKSDPDTAHAFAQMPGWAWAVYAVAVGAGTLGAIALLLRRRPAVALFLLSLVAVIVQFGHSFLATDLLAVKGFGAAAFPAVIVLIGIGQWLYARNQAAKGLLR